MIDEEDNVKVVYVEKPKAKKKRNNGFGTRMKQRFKNGVNNADEGSLQDVIVKGIKAIKELMRAALEAFNSKADKQEMELKEQEKKENDK